MAKVILNVKNQVKPMKKTILALLACCAIAQICAADVTWLTDVSKAEAQAKDQNKIVLMDFTGSDWCSWCKKMDKDTFSKDEFADYAKTNLVLVQLDYPANKPQPDDLKKANADLAQKYNIQGYPTLIALKPNGTIIWTQVGYLEGGPQALIDQLEQAKKK